MEVISCSRFRKLASLQNQELDFMLLKSRWLYSSFIKGVLFTGRLKAMKKYDYPWLLKMCQIKLVSFSLLLFFFCMFYSLCRLFHMLTLFISCLFFGNIWYSLSGKAHSFSIHTGLLISLKFFPFISVTSNYRR